MIYMLDTANIESIKRCIDLYPIGGVTTNPTLAAREKKPFKELIKSIREAIGQDMMLHVQAVSLKAEDIVKEADYLNKMVGGNFYIKIPVIPQGIKAMKHLKKSGIKITATAVFTPQQALMAAEAGADFVAPYVNRIDIASGTGAETIAQIHELYILNGITTRILAASFSNTDQVNRAALAGAHAITAPPEIYDKIMDHPMTNQGVENFIKDWEAFYGPNITTLDA